MECPTHTSLHLTGESQYEPPDNLPSTPIQPGTGQWPHLQCQYQGTAKLRVSFWANFSIQQVVRDSLNSGCQNLEKVSPSVVTPNLPQMWHQNAPDFPSVATPFSPHLRHNSLLGFWGGLVGGVGWGGIITFMYPRAHKHCTLITQALHPHLITQALHPHHTSTARASWFPIVVWWGDIWKNKTCSKPPTRWGLKVKPTTCKVQQ